jgi:PAS domain S-box-containing protein
MSTPEPIEEILRREQSILARLPVAVAQCSAGLQFLWVSQRYADWLGMERTEIEGRPMAAVLSSERLQSMRPHMDAALAGRPTVREVEITHGKGRRWIHVDAVPTFDASGLPNGWIEAIVDVTERRAIEESLRDSQVDLQSFYGSSPFFMGLVELEGDSLVMLSCNRALAQAMGITSDQLAHRRIDEISSPEIARLWAEKYRQARREGGPVQFEYEQSEPFRGRWLRATVAFVGDEKNGRGRFSFVADEITAERKIIEALRDANRSKDDFLAILGHELRNPLAPIVTAVQLLKQRCDGQYAKTLGIIERQVNQLIRLVDDLLDVARFTSGNFQIKRQLLRLQDAVAQGVELAMPLLEQRRHHLSIRLPPQDLRLRGDEVRLAQVVSNLLTNAAKYTDPGGEIVIEGRQEGTELVLTVKDNGMGIEPELLPHVFDLFTQERQSIDRSKGGLGVGLTIVRNLVELHGGTAEAKSAGRGMGSSFTIRLPAVTEEPAAIAAHVGTGSMHAAAPLRVLAVDDNEDALDMTAEVLRAAGHTVMTAMDGPSALKAVDSFHPDVGVLDIGLPVMDGYELAQRIRAQCGDDAPRLIALTGYGQESDRNRARSAGFAGHLTKPVDVDRLLGAVDAVT